MVTLWFQYGSVFAGTIAFVVGATGCSEPPQQELTKAAEVSSEGEKMLAVEEQPERSEGDLTQRNRGGPIVASGEVVETSLDQLARRNRG